ncbi:hypothetical protein AB0O62_30195 [Streptomyces sp. NPDC086779]|uniref:hypothetical protein n=1 Tax=Streptomyces sp. NPDC086779 TaxID=3156670 RepID=UPI003422F5AC
MESEVLTVLATAGVASVLTFATSALRDVLFSIFKRPRETSMIVEVGGKKLVVKALDADALEQVVAQLRAGETPNGRGVDRSE